MKEIFLSGIKPTGDIHLGNYVGMIRPSVELMKQNPEAIFLFFIADYHALNFLSKEERKNIKKYTHQILSSYIAGGIDPKRAIFYRQSDIREIFELQNILNNFTPKSILNSAHAYKTKVLNNQKNHKDSDNGINLGLYNYPLLMSADILIFNANQVPVGPDQVQHIEIASDIAHRFNHNVKKVLIPPKPYLKESISLPGIDGEKMSKSYSNTIPLFSTEKILEKRIAQIITDSSDKDESKPIDNNIIKIFEYFNDQKKVKELQEEFKNGLSYGLGKKKLKQSLVNYFKNQKEIYDKIINDGDYLENILKEGKETVSVYAERNLKKVKKSLNLI